MAEGAAGAVTDGSHKVRDGWYPSGGHGGDGFAASPGKDTQLMQAGQAVRHPGTRCRIRFSALKSWGMAYISL